ncbi:hypothetical protein Noda2021_00950 [Candidatus Dependentiae bacterium Noda2021]|nr:hypothetical protein Noda2021_00950 [Candidatus Dependentiae bacterium Noda2021]
MKKIFILSALIFSVSLTTRAYYKSCWIEQNDEDSITAPYNYTYYVDRKRYIGLPYKQRCGVSLSDYDIISVEYELENINPLTPITDALIYYYRETVTGKVLLDFYKNELAFIVGEALRLIAESHGAQTRRQKDSVFDVDGL